MEANKNRREYKFLLPPGLVGRLRNLVAEHLEIDRGATEGYPILSEYYDTEDRMSYWEKRFGVTSRRRIRSRIYGHRDGDIPPTSFIEVKHKHNGTVVKRRVMVGLAQVTQLSSERIINTPDDAPSSVVTEITELMENPPKHPVVQIRYHRYAYDSGPDGTIRITFDTDPCCRFRDVPLAHDDSEFELPLLPPGEAIMEVKTIGPVPYWFRSLIGRFKLVPRGFSKYATALEKYEMCPNTTKTAINGHQPVSQ
ncbi:MAG: polyphosphate polymerase domain-containing protein [Verrucomicrobiales bacterium]|nr:polyphosphate polymerase domain-containing protein [Verrucomicrobiota bacterium JB025]